MKTVLIRADASVDIGNGHVMRCLSLGQMLQEAGYRVQFLTTTQNNRLIERIKKENFEVEQIAEKISLENDAKITNYYCKENNIDWLFTDGYKFDTNYQRFIKNENIKLCCIDDINSFHFVSDIVINQNLSANELFNYSTESYTKLLLGLKYAMLREEFRSYKANDIKRDANSKENILITMGGSDSKNYTLRILEALQEFNNEIKIRVLLGSSYLHYKLLEKYLRENKFTVQILQGKDDIVSDFEWADITITAAGSTVWELLKMEKKIITIIVAENQEKIANQLEKEKLADNLGWISLLSNEELKKNLTQKLINTNIDVDKIHIFADQIGVSMPNSLLNLMEK